MYAEHPTPYAPYRSWGANRLNSLRERPVSGKNCLDPVAKSRRNVRKSGSIITARETKGATTHGAGEGPIFAMHATRLEVSRMFNERRVGAAPLPNRIRWPTWTSIGEQTEGFVIGEHCTIGASPSPHFTDVHSRRALTRGCSGRP